MADVKNYLVNYIVNSEGNAANFFQSLVTQAEKAQAAITAARENILKISGNMGQALGNVKDAWNIIPTVDISKAMASLKDLETKVQAAAARMRKDIATAMNGVQGGAAGIKSSDKDIKQARNFLAARNTEQLKLQKELLNALPSQQADKISKAVDQLWSKEDISSKVLTRIGKLPDAKAKLKTLREYIDESAKLKSEINAQAAKAQKAVAPTASAQTVARQGFEANNIAALNELEKKLQETQKVYGESKAKYENLLAARKRAMYEYGMQSKGFYPTWKEVFNEPEKAATLPKFLSNYVSDAHKNDAALASSKSSIETYGKQIKTLEEQIANTKKISGSAPVTLSVALNTAPAIEMANELIRTIGTRGVTIPVTIGMLGEKPNSLAYKDSIDKVTGKATEAGKEMANKTNQLIAKQQVQTQKNAKAEIPGVVSQITNSVKSINNLLKDQPVNFVGRFDGGAVMQQLEATLAKLKAYAQANPIPLIGEMSKAVPSSKGGKVVSKGKAGISGTAEGSVESIRSKLQSQANEKPITFRSAFNGGDAAFQANLSRQRIQQLVNEKPITFRSAFNGGDAAFQANLSLARLQRLVGEKPITISGKFAGIKGLNEISNTSKQPQINVTAKVTTTAAQLTNQVNAIVNKVKPKAISVSVKAKTINLSSDISKAVQKAKAKGVDIPVKVKSSNVASDINKLVQNVKGKGIEIPVKVKTTGVKANINRAISQAKKASNIGKGLTVPIKFSASGVSAKFKALLKNLQTQANKNPIKVKAQFENGNIINAFNQSIADLNKSIKQLAKMRKEGFVNAGSKSGASERTSGVFGGVSSRSSYARSLGLLPTDNDRIYRRPTQDMYTRARSFFYPLTGNTSFGARTPAMVDMAKGMGTMFAVGGAMSAVGSSLSQAVEYQNTMKTVEAILRTSDKSFTTGLFGNMSRNVRNVGKETKFTAPQVANAARFMAMAGLSTKDINNSIRPVADIALIGDTDLGTTADKLTNVMTTFGLKSEQMREIADIMTSTFTRSNTDMMMLAESAKYAGGIAHLYGGKDFMKTFSDTMAMFGILGNAGIQASSAGTTIRMMYQNLMQPNKKQLEALKKYGIFTRDTKGQPLQMGDIISQMAQNIPRDKMADAIGQMFRITAQPGAATLASHVGQLSELMAANRAAEGSNISGQIANEKKNTLSGLWAQVTSTFTEGVVQAMENREGGWAGMLAKLRDYLADPKTVEMISNIIDLVEMMAKTMASFAKIWAGAYHMFPNLINGWLKIQMLMTQIGYLFTPIIQVIGTITMLKSSILGLTGSFGSAAIAARRATMVNRSLGIETAVSGAATSATVGKRYAAKRFGYGGLLYGSAAMDEAYQAAKYKKWQYEISRNRLRNSVMYHGERTAVSPLWYGTTMAQFGLNKDENPAEWKKSYVESRQWMKERSMFAATNIEARQAAARRADEAIRRQQAMMTEQLRAMRRPEQLASNALMMRYAAMYGGRKGANVNWVNRGIRIREANAAALAARRPGQIVNQELMKRFYMSGGKGGFGLGMKGAFQRGLNMGTIGLSSAGLIGGIKSTFYSLMAGLSKAIGLLVSPVGLATMAIAGLSAISIKLYNDAKKYKEHSIKNANEGFNRFEQNVDKINQRGTNLRKQFGYEELKPINVPDSPNTLANLQKRSKLYADILNPDMDQEISNRKWISKMYSSNNAMLGLTPELREKYFGQKLYGTFEKEYRKGVVNNAKYDGGASALASLITTKFAAQIDNATAANMRAKSALIYQAASADKTISAQQQIAQLRQQYLNKQLTEANYRAKAQRIINSTVQNDLYHSLNAEDFTSKQILASDPTRFLQYQQAVQNVLNAELNGSIGSITGRLNAIDAMKKNVSAYSNQWWNGIAHIIDGMRYTFQAAGKSIDIAIRSLPNGRIDYSAIVAQIRTIASNLQLNISDFSNMASSVYQQLLSMGAVHGNYYRDWGKFVYENTKHANVTAADAGAHFDKYYGKGNPNATWHGMSRKEYIDYVKSSSSNKNSLAAKERVLIRKSNANSVGFAAKRQYDKNTKSLRQQQVAAQKITNTGNVTGVSNHANGASSGHSGGNSGSNQKDYASNYGRNAARPTQVNITIDKLCSFDRTMIAKNADDKAMIEAIENKLAEAIAMLSASALNSAGTVIAQGLA